MYLRQPVIHVHDTPAAATWHRRLCWCVEPRCSPRQLILPSEGFLRGKYSWNFFNPFQFIIRFMLLMLLLKRRLCGLPTSCFTYLFIKILLKIESEWSVPDFNNFLSVTQSMTRRPPSGIQSTVRQHHQGWRANNSGKSSCCPSPHHFVVFFLLKWLATQVLPTEWNYGRKSGCWIYCRLHDYIFLNVYSVSVQ